MGGTEYHIGCNVSLTAGLRLVNDPINSNRGIHTTFSGVNLDFTATNCVFTVLSSYSHRTFVADA